MWKTRKLKIINDDDNDDDDNDDCYYDCENEAIYVQDACGKETAWKHKA